MCFSLRFNFSLFGLELVPMFLNDYIYLKHSGDANCSYRLTHKTLLFLCIKYMKTAIIVASISPRPVKLREFIYLNVLPYPLYLLERSYNSFIAKI